MSWSGSGVFNRLYSWIADAAAGIDITASRMDADTNDIVTSGLGNCITRDGQGVPTANLPMAGFRHTGAQAAVGTGDYVTLGQLAGTNGSVATVITQTLTATGAVTFDAATTFKDGILLAASDSLSFIYTDPSTGPYGGNDIAFRTGALGSYAYSVLDSGANFRTPGAIYPGAGVLVGATSNPIANAADGFQTIAGGSTQVYNASTTPLSVGVGFSGGLVGFFFGATPIGSISTSGSSVAYNTTSDRRLKNLAGTSDGSLIDRLKVHLGAFKSRSSETRSMLVADELQAEAPYFVQGEAGAVDKAGKIIPQMVDHSALVPDLIAKCQSLQAQINELKAGK
jgi:hypothetical protein